MLAGVARALKTMKPEIRIWGVETVGDAVTEHQALQAGKPVDEMARLVAGALTLLVSMLHLFQHPFA